MHRGTRMPPIKVAKLTRRDDALQDLLREGLLAGVCLAAITVEIRAVLSGIHLIPKPGRVDLFWAGCAGAFPSEAPMHGWSRLGWRRFQAAHIITTRTKHRVSER